MARVANRRLAKIYQLPRETSPGRVSKEDILLLAQNAHELARVWGLIDFYTPELIKKALEYYH